MIQVSKNFCRRTAYVLRNSSRSFSSFKDECEELLRKEGDSGGKQDDDVADKPATKSLVNEMLMHQRKQMPHLSSHPPDSDSILKGSAWSSTTDSTVKGDTRAGTEPENTAASTNSDLFDAFPILGPPAAVAERSPNAFDEVAYQQYMEIVDPILKAPEKLLKKGSSKPIKDEVAKSVFDWIRLDEPALSYDLPTFQRALKEGVTALHPVGDNERDGTFRQEIQLQCDKFVETMGFNEKQLTLASNCMFLIANTCAKNAKGGPVEVLWEKVKEGGFSTKNFLHNLLYVSATFSTGSARSRAKRQSKYAHLTGMTSILDVLGAEGKDSDGNKDGEEDVVDITDEIAIYRDLLHEPTEQSINIRIRLLVAQGKAKEAEKLLDETMSGKVELKLRAYSPVMRLYLELGDVASALALFNKMQTIPTVHLETETFIHLICGIAKHGGFRPSAPPIEGAKELGYSQPSGPGLLDEIVEEMTKESFEISEAAAKKLYDALACGFPESSLEETTSLSPLRLTDQLSTKNEVLANRVRIDPSTGVCPRSGVKLRLVQLKDHEKERLLNGVLSLAKSRHRQHRTTNKVPSSQQRTDSAVSANKAAEMHLRQFYDYLDKRGGKPFTVICDGANLGYFSQNYDDGRFSYYQIKFMVEALERLGENPLVVLPYKYTRDWFHTSFAGSFGFRKQNLTEEELAIRNDLIYRDKVLCVPPSMLDDFYWILASVSPQTNSRQGRDLSVAPGNPQGRWPGTRPVLLTNDQLRDHQIEMLEPMLFRRWYSNLIVNYNFAAFVDGKCTHPEVGFSPADFFSREVQGNRDEHGSMVWHFPLIDKEDEWFCIRVPVDEATD